MRTLLTITALVMTMTAGAPTPTHAQTERTEAEDHIASCETAIRHAVLELGQIPIAVSSAMVTQWYEGMPDWYGIPSDCVLPTPPIPVHLRGLEYAWCLWWVPLSGDNGAAGEHWECLYPGW
jgi:hypothetical protein